MTYYMPSDHYFISTKLSEWNKAAKGRTSETVRQCKPPPSPHFYTVDSPVDNCGNWSQNLITTSSWDTPHRSRKFHQNPFITYLVSLILLTIQTHMQMPLKHNLMTTLHGLMTIFFTGFHLNNTGVVNCLIMCQNARKMHHSEAKIQKISTDTSPKRKSWIRQWYIPLSRDNVLYV